MLHLHFGKNHHNISDAVKENGHLSLEVKEVFIGHKTIFTLLGFLVGGILVGNTLLEYSWEYLGRPWTLVIGMILFVLSGITLRQFRK